MSAWEASGKSNEWYTPKYIFDALGERFDLDVAAPPSGPLHVPCDTFFWSDSLSREWEGFIWMNPPFGGRGDKDAWLDRFFAHGHGVALTPDRTSAPWFRKAWDKADAALFLPKVKFIDPSGAVGKSPSNGTCLWAAGDRAHAALKRAQAVGLGILALPVVKEAANG